VGVASPGDKGRRHMACTGGGAGEPASECPASGEVNWIPTRRPARGSGARDHPPPRPRAPGRVATPRRGGTPRLPAGRQLSVPAPGFQTRHCSPHRPRWLVDYSPPARRGSGTSRGGDPAGAWGPGPRARHRSRRRGTPWPVRVE